MSSSCCGCSCAAAAVQQCCGQAAAAGGGCGVGERSCTSLQRGPNNYVQCIYKNINVFVRGDLGHQASVGRGCSAVSYSGGGNPADWLFQFLPTTVAIISARHPPALTISAAPAQACYTTPGSCRPAPPWGALGSCSWRSRRFSSKPAPGSRPANGPIHIITVGRPSVSAARGREGGRWMCMPAAATALPLRTLARCLALTHLCALQTRSCPTKCSKRRFG